MRERFVGGDRVCVMLADNVLERSFKPSARAFAAQERGARILLARESDPEHLRHLGVPELDGDGRIARIVEKPDDAAERVRRHRHLLLRRDRLGRACRRSARPAAASSRSPT